MSMTSGCKDIGVEKLRFCQELKYFFYPDFTPVYSSAENICLLYCVLCRSTAAGQQRSRAGPGAGKRIEDRAELQESTKHPSGQSTSQQILSFFAQLFKAAKNKYNT